MKLGKVIEATFPLRAIEPCKRSATGELTGSYYLQGRDRDANFIAYAGLKSGEDFRAFAEWIFRTLNDAAIREVGVEGFSEDAWAGVGLKPPFELDAITISAPANREGKKFEVTVQGASLVKLPRGTVVEWVER